jgi:hypothetical protein
VAEAIVERWGYVRACGAEFAVDLFRMGPAWVEGHLHSGGRWAEWRAGEPAVWELDPESCVRSAAAARGHEVARVVSPAERRVDLRLSRASAAAWARLLAEWSAVGTLGEPGEEFRGELARVLGEVGR